MSSWAFGAEHGVQSVNKMLVIKRFQKIAYRGEGITGYVTRPARSANDRLNQFLEKSVRKKPAPGR